ncbi:MAG TPA: ABC transporter family substrate-binding protein [Streptosporangiaceae bacterium]|jgi:peptide/nickel transport system substrate-binding protein
MTPSLSRPRARWLAFATAAAAASLVVAACGGSSSPSAGSSPGTVKSGGTATFALDEDVAGFNVLQASDNEFVLQEILDQTWPQAFLTPPNLTPTLNKDLLTSATVTSSSPQTVVYKINPKATWSDGTPISAADFIYNWQAQSGNPKYKDLGGAAYLDASTAGFNDIKSVTSSDGGKTATVVFSAPYGDWRALFSPLIPAHIAQKVGWNNGFQTFGPAVQVSGGPYMIQSYTKGEDLVEVRNPKWWGTPGKLSKIVFRFILDDSQQPPAVQNGEANLVNPALAALSFYDSVKNISGFTTKVDAGLEYQHMDFNEANPYLANVNVRHAIAWGTNRAQMVARIVTPMAPSIKPLNNRLWMATQPAYKDTSGIYGAYDPAKAKAALTSAGMTMGSDGYFHPNSGPLKGQDLSFNISTTSGVEVRAQIEQLFQASMKNIGIKINVKNYDANTFFGTVLPKGEFDIGEFAWVLTPFDSANQPIFCSYTNTAVCGNDWDHYANPTVDKLFTQAAATIDPTQSAAIYNQIDTILWKDMVTLPLFQQPDLTGYSTKLAGVQPNTSSVGVTWNAQDWGDTTQ